MASIHILPPETARLIAAGEVIDRPASALRELLDNAIDAGASEIQVSIEKGGIDLIRVVDNGCGMSKEDLELSIHEHATSKIEHADDLLKTTTLGFRGEALASIASVARLEMVSCETSSEIGWKLQKEPGKDTTMKPVASRQGTMVTVQGIFEHYPARRQFLKRPMSEAMLCRQVFIERAIAHPSIAFGWNSGSESENYPVSPLEQRIGLLYPDLPGTLFSRFETKSDDVSIVVIFADPSFHRKDRKYLQIFVNRRKVPEWGLSSVLEYAFSEYLPGGMKPCAFLLAEINPALADFNIHPAKREVRIKNIEAIKSTFFSSFQAYLHKELGAGPTDLSVYPEREMNFPDLYAQEGSGLRYAATEPHYATTEAAFWDKLAASGRPEEQDLSTARASAEGPGAADAEDFRYLGRAFGPFLLFEKDSVLYILDQHAAHERILYDELMGSQSASQALLVPFVFDDDSGGFKKKLGDSLPELARMGFSIEASQGSFTVNGVPAFLGEKAIQALLDYFSGDSAPDDAGKDIVATMACRAAVKDGDVLDDAAARELIRMSLKLPFPRCPHGRPIWVKLDKTALYRMVGRYTG